MHDLVLDPAIRNWVLLPIVAIMLLVTVNRSWVQVLLKGDPNTKISKVKQMQTLHRSGKVRGSSRVLAPSSYAMRKAYFVTRGTGKLRAKVEGATNPMQNPDGMMEMMKTNMSMMIPNVVMMGWISYFFNGFVLVKVPFMLTTGFKEMLQRGVELQTLDVSYVSSLSWYFLVMFGLRGLFALLLGDTAMVDDTTLMQQQMQMGAANPQFDAKAAFKNERLALNLLEHKFAIDDADIRYLKS